MKTIQINLKLPENLAKAAEQYVKSFGYRNIQELAAESMRDKIMERNEYDENITREELVLIDTLISSSVKRKKIVSEEGLMRALLK